MHLNMRIKTVGSGWNADRRELNEHKTAARDCEGFGPRCQPSMARHGTPVTNAEYVQILLKARSRPNEPDAI